MSVWIQRLGERAAWESGREIYLRKHGTSLWLATRALAGDSAGGAGGSDLAVGPRIYPDAWRTHRAGQRGAAGLEVPLGRVAAPLLSLARARLLTTLCCGARRADGRRGSRSWFRRERPRSGFGGCLGDVARLR